MASATSGMWLGNGIPGPEAYMLLGQIAEARCTQMVNPEYTYICKVAKKYVESAARK